MLYAAIEQSPSAELVDREMLTRYFAKFDEEFFITVTRSWRRSTPSTRKRWLRQHVNTAVCVVN